MYSEIERRSRVNQIRKQMPCRFKGPFTFQVFKSLAVDTARQISRIKRISMHDAVVRVTVKSQSNLSDWEFVVDFNNWGHIDGTYWMYSENDDSSIPKHYGNILSGKVCDYLNSHGIVVPNFSGIVDANTSLGTENSLNTNYTVNYTEDILRKIFRRGIRSIHVEYNNTFFRGEHVYPVISMLKKNGFVNIRSIPIEDVDNKNSHYIFKVESVSIAGATNFQYGRIFPHNAEVLIYYHSRRRIMIPYSENKLRRKSRAEVRSCLFELGFTEIYEREVKDLIVGLITKDGSVENVYAVNDGKETPIERGKMYYYDTKFIVCYHTYK